MQGIRSAAVWAVAASILAISPAAAGTSAGVDLAQDYISVRGDGENAFEYLRRRQRGPEPEAPLSISREEGEGKPTYGVEPGLLDNRSEFKSEFYDAATLRPATLRFDDGRTKEYFFPTLYGDVTTAVAVFLCSRQKAESLLKARGIRGVEPVSMGRAHSALILTSYRYNKVFGIAPYNEIAVSIPVIASGKPNLPLVGLLHPDGYYVASMPVTTFENQQRGLKFWGLPKVVQRIDLFTEGDHYVTAAYDASGEEYVRFRVPMSGVPKTSEQTATIISALNGRVLRSETRSQGTFHSTRFPDALRLLGGGDSATELSVGTSPSTDLLRELDIYPYPFETRFGRRVSSTFDLPKP
ncbi:MAG: acetoacetate decarboxylase family protein [Elusimicrobia bacterium]|nr:acetoacetate decarboxylase family protein [Elusimicrobiota bacterium]